MAQSAKKPFRKSVPPNLRQWFVEVGRLGGRPRLPESVKRQTKIARLSRELAALQAQAAADEQSAANAKPRTQRASAAGSARTFRQTVAR